LPSKFEAIEPKEDEVVFVKEPLIRTMMKVNVTCDNRAILTETAAQYLLTLKKIIENPQSYL
jgi:pyruvate/2-oxoglutarate dehydrogenase complex dihydrolipoamide acyltransferase (E2) component